MEIKRFDYIFSVCKVKDVSMVDFNQEYCFVGKTDEELSVVCLTDCVPKETVERDDGWKAFRIQGVLDFSLIGILELSSSIRFCSAAMVASFSAIVLSFSVIESFNSFTEFCNSLII